MCLLKDPQMLQMHVLSCSGYMVRLIQSTVVNSTKGYIMDFIENNHGFVKNYQIPVSARIFEVSRNKPGS